MCGLEMCTCDKGLGKTLIFALVAWNKPEAPSSISYSASFCLHFFLQPLYLSTQQVMEKLHRPCAPRLDPWRRQCKTEHAG